MRAAGYYWRYDRNDSAAMGAIVVLAICRAESAERAAIGTVNGNDYKTVRWISPACWSRRTADCECGKALNWHYFDVIAAETNLHL